MRVIILFTLLLPSIGICQLDANMTLFLGNDTIMKFPADSSKLETHVLGMVRYLNEGFESEKIDLSKIKTTRSSDKLTFLRGGKLIVNSCFSDCGKYICDFYGTWTVNKNTVTLDFTNVDNEEHNFIFTYEFNKVNENVIQLKRINN